jgi:hypothetical protein
MTKFSEQPGFIPPYQDAETLADHLCISVRTIDEWTKIGRLPPPRVQHGDIRLWKWADVSRCQPKAIQQGFIYFLRCGPFVKIGFTKSLQTRLRTHRTSNPMPITVLHTMPGNRADEANLLLKFAHLKHHGEWFNATPKLLNFIKSLVRGT